MLKSPAFRAVRFVLLDIEGTVSDIDFVRNVLFPYSAKMLRNYVSQHRHNATVRACLCDASAAGDETAIQTLLDWIAADNKHPALKTLQGLIWRDGYESGAFRSHLYPEVVTTWSEWRAAGLRLGIYSSGSRAAQDLFFHYSEQGDVRAHLEAYFDLATGAKREIESYRKIATALDLPPGEILFLSDVSAELDAARSAGFLTGLVMRGESAAATARAPHPVFHSLAEV